MNETINLSDEAASGKLKDLTKEVKICMMSTDLQNDNGAATRPMGVQHSDDDDNLWFFSDKESNKNRQIIENGLVQLYFSEPGKNTYISLTGNAEVVLNDRSKIDELWNPLMKTWFKDGKEDPKISLIKVKPVEGYYWDSTGNRFINFFKMVGSVITGKTLVDSEQGTLKP